MGVEKSLMPEDGGLPDAAIGQQFINALALGVGPRVMSQLSKQP
jgi:hypothetical protein